jgi:hypothetical protein
MSDIPDSVLVALKLRERELQINIAMNQGALDEIRRIIAEVERRRGGRPRKSAIIEMPQRVAGGVAETETDEQLFPEDAAQ